MKNFDFPCGCQIPILSENPLRLDLSLDIKKIPLNCQRTWDMISSGDTKGCFQIESDLGRSWAEKIKPKNINELSDLIALIRPSCLETYLDTKNITQHYADRKNGEETVEYFHPALKEILQDTLGLLLYQESSLLIAQKIAGFDLQTADLLRIAASKKKVDLMRQMKTKFLEGCVKQQIVTQEEAEEIFGWIEKAQRYQFNKSHAVGYAYNTYMSAYLKAHVTKAFYTSWLYYAQDKQKPFDELNELINDAKLASIDVCVPDFRRRNNHFELIDGKIYFGFLDIKGIGRSLVDKMDNKIKELQLTIGPSENWYWSDFIIHFSQHISATVIQHLIKTGALDYMNITRTRMLFEYNLFAQLSKKEQLYLTKHYNKSTNTTLLEILNTLTQSPTGREGGISNKNRKTKINNIIQILQQPPYELDKDMIEWIAAVEEYLLGISLTRHKVDAHESFQANCTCFEFLKNKNIKQSIHILGHIDNINAITTKKGDPMAFLTVSDSSGLLNSTVVFPKIWKEYKDQIETKTVVLLCGNRGKYPKSFIVEKILKIS